MARLVQIAPDVAVAWQVDAEDIGEIAARGFRSVVNNRPDAEPGPAYISAAQAEAASKRHGLAYAFLPVTHDNITDEALADAFHELLSTLPKPILAYCRTGTRCSLLWALARARDLGARGVVEGAAAAGYDVSVLLPELEERAQAAKPPAADAPARVSPGEARAVVA